MLSYAHGPDAPILEQPIYDVFAETAHQHAFREALVSVHQNQRFTFAELLNAVEATAHGLAGLGLRAGDRFGVWAANCSEWVLLQLAAARAGLVLININPAYRSNELAYVLRRSGMKALFLHERDQRSDYAAILRDASEGREIALKHTVFFDTRSWQEFLSRGTAVEPISVSNHDVANIQYTSGTTGSPKGVLLTHRNLLNNGYYIAQALRLTEQDRICLPVPFYHCFGCVIGTMAAITTGAAIILPSPRFDPSATMKAISAERATLLYGVPTMFIAQLDHPDFGATDFTSLRGGVMAGSPCPIEIMKRVATEMHCPGIAIMYGQTESSPVITGSSVDDPMEVRVSTVGRAYPNTEVKIVDANGDTVPVGEQGELCTRGYLVMQGYDQDPEATARAIDPESWLHTGDLAMMRPDGYFRITGRAKDMIIRGGENVYPREVEEFLYQHPKIADVQVVGLPDAKLGETVLAWIQLRAGETATEEEIREFCRGKIAHFKIPQHVRFVDAFPMTITGKIQKYRIREFEIHERGLESTANILTA